MPCPLIFWNTWSEKTFIKEKMQERDQPSWKPANKECMHRTPGLAVPFPCQWLYKYIYIRLASNKPSEHQMTYSPDTHAHKREQGWCYFSIAKYFPNQAQMEVQTFLPTAWFRNFALFLIIWFRGPICDSLACWDGKASQVPDPQQRTRREA